MLANDKIVVAGTGDDDGFLLARYFPNGDIDESFGQDGFVHFDVHGMYLNATAMVRQPDGKFVVTGTGIHHDLSTRIVVARFNTDGSLDESFGDGGSIVIDYDGIDTTANDVALQADGGIILVGTFDSAQWQQFLVMRLNPDGQIDWDFGDYGLVTILGDGFTTSADAVAVDEDGSIVFAGTFYDYVWSIDTFVSRLYSDGTWDEGFGDFGTTWVNSSDYSERIKDIEIDAEGGILVAADSMGDDFYWDMAMFRLLPWGEFDTEFGDSGWVRIGNWEVDDIANGITVSPDGTIFLVGAMMSLNGYYSNAVTAFDQYGQFYWEYFQYYYQYDVIFSYPRPFTNDIAQGAVLQSDGGLVLYGSTAWDGQDQDISLFRITPSGQVDTHFGTDLDTLNDRVLPSGSFYAQESRLDVVTGATTMLSGGRLISAGVIENSVYVTLLTEDGWFDDSFGTAGRSVIPLPFEAVDLSITSVAVQNDGKILIGGSTNLYGDNREALLIRLNPDGSLDIDFGMYGFVIDETIDEVCYVTDLAVMETGEIVILTDTRDVSNTRSGVSVVRYLADGSRDVTFGVDGISVVNYDDAEYAYSKGMSIDSDGTVTVLGAFFTVFGYHDVVVQLSPDGSSSSSFGVSGAVFLDFDSYYGYFNDIEVQSDGKFILTGSVYNGSSYDIGVVRLDTNGSYDSTFGTDGLAVINTNEGFDEGAFELAIQSNGDINLLGYRDFDTFVMRLLDTGSIDSSFGHDGMLFVGLESYFDSGLGIYLDPSENILVTEIVYGVYNTLAVYRIDSEGLIDTTYGEEPIPIFVEGGDPVSLDLNVVVYDTELVQFGDFWGASVLLQREGGADPTDEFSSGGMVTPFIEGEDFYMVDWGIVGYVIQNSGGVLNLLFYPMVNDIVVSQILQSIHYANTSPSPDSEVSIEWLFSDGNYGDQGPGGEKTVLGVSTVQILPTNSPPHIEVDSGIYQTRVNETLDFADAITIVDPDGANVEVLVLLSTDHGTLFLGNVNGINLEDGSNGSGSMLISGTLTAINNTLLGLSFVPEEDFFGTATVYVVVDDQGNLGAGSNLGDEYDIPVNVRQAGVALDGDSLIFEEQGGSGDLIFVLTSAPTDDVTLNFSTFFDVSGRCTVTETSLTFTPANWFVPQSITFTGIDNDLSEGDFFFTITTDIESNDPVYDGLLIDEMSVTITDDDTTGVNAAFLESNTTTEDGGTATLILSLTSQPIYDVYVYVNSTDPNEGAVWEILIFTPYNWNQPQSVDVVGQDDFIADGTVQYTVEISTYSDDESYDVGYYSALVLENEDNDTAGIQISPVETLFTSEAGGYSTIQFVLQSEPTSSVTIALQSLNPDEGIINYYGVIFTPDNWNVPQYLVVIGQDDHLDDGDVEYTVEAAAFSQDPNYNLEDFDQLVLTNLDNDEAPVAVDDTIATDEDTTVRIAVADNDSAPSSSLDLGSIQIVVWPSHGTAWIDTNTHEIVYTPDPDYYGADSLNYRIANAVGLTAEAVVNLTIDEVRGATPGITIDDLTELVTDETGGSATFQVSLLSQPTSPVVIQIISNDVSEGRPAVGILVFTTTNWNVPQVVTIEGVDDILDDDDVEYSISFFAFSDDPNYDLGTFDSRTLTNEDDDQVPVALNDFVDTDEDTAVRISVADNDSAPNSTLNLDSIQIVDAPAHGTALIDSNTHEIVYTPNHNYTGFDTLTYRIANAIGLTDLATVIIDVASTNDAPVITVPSNLPRLFIKKGDPIYVLPNVSVSDTEGNLAGGTLKITFDWAVGKTGEPYDVLFLPTSPNISDTPFSNFAAAWQRVEGHRELTLTLNSNATAENIAAFLQGITFWTFSKGAKAQTRTLQITLTDNGDDFALLTQTINLRSSATTSSKPPKNTQSQEPETTAPVPMAPLSMSITAESVAMPDSTPAASISAASTLSTPRRRHHRRKSVKVQALQNTETLQTDDSSLLDSLFASPLMYEVI
ncbi:MAG: hypothetical protein KDA36_00465 [Planctomycetaceae bacterium]|nr:hypothetical protein [Planctomycetaceae bacterium]